MKLTTMKLCRFFFMFLRLLLLLLSFNSCQLFYDSLCQLRGPQFSNLTNQGPDMRGEGGVVEGGIGGGKYCI